MMVATESEGTEKYVPRPDSTWQKNAPSQIALNSIFAALAGILLVFSAQDPLAGTWHKFLELMFSLFSFLLFARSAEGTINALDEKDVRQFVYYLIWYNLAVVFLVVSIAVLVYAYFAEHFLSFCQRNFPLLSICKLQCIGMVLFFIFFVALLKCWLWDFFWLIRVRREELIAYIEELEDIMKPKPEPSRLFNLWDRWKN
jgi:hypothetical protein